MFAPIPITVEAIPSNTAHLLGHHGHQRPEGTDERKDSEDGCGDNDECTSRNAC
jgi:hypothetical protein